MHPSPTLLPTELNAITVLVLLVISLTLIFAGRMVIKGVAFIVAGLGTALIGSAAGSMLFGSTGVLLGGLVGFLAGGLLSLILLPLGVAIILGYVGYSLAENVLSFGVLSIAVAVLLFVFGLVLSGRILALVSTAIGGIILFNLCVVEGVGPLPASIIAVALGVLGFITQDRRNRATKYQ